MLSLIEDMPRYIHRVNGLYAVENPTIKGENFADKWNDPKDGRQRAVNFVKWHRQVCIDMRELLTSEDPKVIRDASERAFGSIGSELSALLVALLLEEVEPASIGSTNPAGLLRNHLSSSEPTRYNEAPKESNHA